MTWICKNCLNEWSSMLGDNELPERCPYCNGEIVEEAHYDFSEHIMHYIDLSTVHITRNDTKLLSERDFDYLELIVYKYPEGFFIFIGYEDDTLPYITEKFKEKGFSDDFLTLFSNAVKSHTATFLRLDCDGIVNENIPMHDW